MSSCCLAIYSSAYLCPCQDLYLIFHGHCPLDTLHCKMYMAFITFFLLCLLADCLALQPKFYRMIAWNDPLHHWLPDIGLPKVLPMTTCCHLFMTVNGQLPPADLLPSFDWLALLPCYCVHLLTSWNCYRDALCTCWLIDNCSINWLRVCLFLPAMSAWPLAYIDPVLTSKSDFRPALLFYSILFICWLFATSLLLLYCLLFQTCK